MRRFEQRYAAALLAIVLTGSLAGCDALAPEPESTLRELIAASNALADSLERVQDADSALAATPEIESGFARALEVFKRLPGVIQKHKDKKASKRTVDELMRDCSEAEQRLKKEFERLDRIRGLPAEFWGVTEMGAANIQVAMIEYIQTLKGPVPEEAANYIYNVQALLKEHGHKKVMALELTNLPANLAQQAFDRMGDAAPSAKLYHFAEGNAHDVRIGPVDSIQTIADAIDFGTIVYQDEGRRLVRVEVDRRKLGARANSDAEEMQLRAEESRKRHEESMAKIEASRAHIEAEQARRAEEQARREEENRYPEPDDPDYYEQLLKHVVADHSWHKDKAIKVLLNTDPSEVESAETQKKIARAFKDMAFNDTFKRKEGIRGMVVWGGQYSVPLLLDLLADDPPFIKKEIFKALGDLKDARAASPVAARLGNFFDHKDAYNCLRRMGPAAEDALIAVAPSNDPKISMSAVELLGEVGTEKSVKLLRQAMRSRNVQVKATAKMALQKVLDRQKAAEQEEVQQ